MRIIFLILGALMLGWAAFHIHSAFAQREHFWFYVCSQGTLVISGIALVIAAKRNYRGHWSFVVGLVLLVLASHAIGLEVDGALAAHRMVQWSSGIFLILVAVLCGVLSLLSANELHRCSIIRENSDDNVV